MIYIILYTFTCTFSLEKNVILHISSYFLAHAITLKIFHSNNFNNNFSLPRNKYPKYL